MKRWLSIVLIVSLVASLAMVLDGCGKGGKDDPTTEPVTESSTGRSMMQDMLDALDEAASERAEYSYTEHSTDEHYEEEYNALTLPPATSAKASGEKKTTSIAVVPQQTRRETTTQFQFTSPSRTATTKASGTTTTAKSGGTTTTGKPGGEQKSEAAVSETVSDTTVMPVRIQESITPTNVTEETRPQVTYLDKYVTNVMRSGSYTLQTEIKSDGIAIPTTVYVDTSKDSYAIKTRIGEALAEMTDMPALLSKLGDVSLITKSISTDPHVYMMFAGGYVEMEDEGDASFKDTLKDLNMAEVVQSLLLRTDGMTYCGLETYPTFVVEKYKSTEDGENSLFCFYFDNQGLAKWEEYDLSGGGLIATTEAQLKTGVPKDAFDLKGKKYSQDDMEKMFGSLAG